MKKAYLLYTSLFIFFGLFAQQAKKEITLEDIWSKGTFRSEGVYGINSMSDGEHYSTMETSGKEVNIEEYEYKSGKKVKTILSSKDLVPEGKKEPITFESYQFSENESKVLLSTESEKIYRHSSIENYYVWDIKNKKLSAVSSNGKQRCATFSPDGNKVAFVRDNNIFIKDFTANKEIQVTTTGKFNSIINGVADWVYEEEFSFTQAFSWSPDGKYVAYYEFDESNVKEFAMNEYQENLYPTVYKYKYPKAGEANSVVKIYVYDLNKGISQPLDLSKEADQYIPRIKWTNTPNVLSVVRMNRHQSKLELILADVEKKTNKIIYTEESDTYIGINESGGDYATFLSDNKSFIIMSERDGYTHLYLYNLNGNLINQITKGNWDVESLKGIDEKTKTLYYVSSEVSPIDRDLYSVKLDGSGKKKLSVGKGSSDADFSSNYKYYISTYSDANRPPFISLYSVDGKQLRVLKDNSELQKKVIEYNYVKKEFFNFKTSENVLLNGWMIKPSSFDSTKKYPVFMTVYGGPGANTVGNSWSESNLAWYQLLAQKGYIVVSVDGRGTGGRGRDFKNCTYKQLGKFETVDQIESAKYLGSLKYVDKNRIGIQGWSFGGYMTLLCMTKGADYFKAGISVAPVTNWRYYDTIYTERYLQTPQENPSGYDDNSPINYADKLKGKLLLVHGTADDNVHFQNTTEMITSLVKANKQFDLFVYPDKAHSISGGNTRLHLYTKMTNFILENL